MAKKLSELSKNAQDAAMENIIHQLITLLGEDPNGATFKETPRHVREAWRFWTSGYTQDPLEVLNPRPALTKDGDDMLIIRDIPIYSHCQRHLSPITGRVHIAFIPKKLTTGQANISRLVDVISRRIQTQQGITNDIADALEGHLKTAGVAIVSHCQHMCLASRGGRNLQTESTIRTFRGIFKNDRKLRDEFLSLLSL